ncbi:ABC transporter permease [Massilia sp. PWRC2]|uniref:ABC transporter permease n=1 Tax=Massilia sp. PWRC2 TaxID=2804626 RepID=UPI003CE72BDE
MSAVELGAVDLAIAASLIVLDAIISLAFGLRLHRQLLVAALRMVIQLLLVGLLLRWLFASDSAALTLAAIGLMMAATVREVAARPRQRLQRWGNARIAAVVVSAASTSTVLLALLTAIRPTPWHDARYAIPLMGIVLGSVLNAASVALDSFLGDLAGARQRIEGRLALGATLREALAPLTRDAVRKGLIPVINQMAAAGIITLPGIMTGQLLAGMDPLSAVKYQILLLFLLAGSSGLAAGGAVWLASRAVGDERDRLRLDRLSR